MNEIEKSIFLTISWFDIFDYPLTLFEIYKYYLQLQNQGFNHLSFETIKKNLEESEFLKEKISYKDGFYFLKWRDDLVKIRKERYLIAEKKYKKLLKIAKILALLPSVKSIAVANGLSYLNSKEEDDIDLFVITEKNRIWLTRFFLILILKFFKARPTPINKKDKICLNFFISEDNLNLKKIMLEEKNGLVDVYFIYWLAWLYPIYDDGIWQEFIKNNLWIKQYLPNYLPQQPVFERKVILSPFLKLIKKIFEKFHSKKIDKISEKFYRLIQLKIMPKHLKEIANQSTSVIINDKILKFHVKDKREIYREKFYAKIRKNN